MIVRPTATAVPLSVCRFAGLPSGRAVADVEAARLVVGRVRARGELAEVPLAGQPGLAVVLLRRRGAEVVDRDRDDAVGDLELRQDRLLDREHPLVLGAALGGLDEAEHLDLVELVHAEDPARVLAGGARLAAEAGREAGVASRERRRRRGSRRACSEASATSEVPTRYRSSVGKLVDLLLGVGQHAGAEERALAYEHRRDHRLEALARAACASAYGTSANSTSTRSPRR